MSDKGERVYLVHSTYKVTGSAHITARNAAEAARIGTEGYPDGSRPDFHFSDAWGETKMTAVRLPQRREPTDE